MEKVTPFVPCLRNDNLFTNLKYISERNFSFRGMMHRRRNTIGYVMLIFLVTATLILFQILILEKKKIHLAYISYLKFKNNNLD